MPRVLQAGVKDTGWKAVSSSSLQEDTVTDSAPIVPIPLRRSGSQPLNVSGFGVGAALAAIPRLLGDAFKMAYVDPYAGRRGPRVLPDDAPEGRDPDW